MLTFASGQRIYLGLEPVDMRKQFNGLWALASEKLREDPRSGALFVFTNKGRFSWPQPNGAAKVHLEPAALIMLLAGIDFRDGCKKAWHER